MRNGLALGAGALATLLVACATQRDFGDRETTTDGPGRETADAGDDEPSTTARDQADSGVTAIESEAEASGANSASAVEPAQSSGPEEVSSSEASGPDTQSPQTDDAPGDVTSDTESSTADDATGAAPATPHRVGSAMFHDSAGGFDQASANLPDATFALPEGVQAGDFMLVFFGADHTLSGLTGTELAARGWTLLDQLTEYGTDGQAIFLMYRFASDDESNPVVFPGINGEDGGYGVQGLLTVYRGVNTVNPIEAYETHVDDSGSEDSTHVVTVTPALATVTPGCLGVAGFSPDSEVDAPTVSVWPAGFDDNQTSVMNPPHPYPNGWANIYTADRPLLDAGAIPESAFEWEITYGGSRYFGAFTFMLALAPQ